MSVFSKIAESLRNADASSLLRHLLQLIESYPKTWASDLLSLGGIPDPQHNACDQAISVLQTAIAELKSSTVVEENVVRQVEDVLQLIADYRQRYVRTRTVLESSKFLDDEQAIRIWRLASHVEDQYHLTMRKSYEIAIEGDNFNTARAAHSVIADESGTQYNLQEIWEGLVECAELAIRYLLHRDGIQPLENANTLYSSYNDPYIAHVLRLAARWRALQVTYDNLRYGGWKRVIETLADESGATHRIETHRPGNLGDLLRKHVSFIRHQMYTVEMMAPLFSAHAAEAEKITLLASSIRVPARGQIWDGAIDLEVLRHAIAESLFPTEMEVAIDAWHYRPWLENLEISYRNGSVAFATWLRVQNVLRIVGSAFMEAIDAALASEEDELRRIIRVSKASLLEIVSAGCELREDECERALDSLIYDAERRGVDWWDMPLLPLGNNELIIVPSILVASNPTQIIEAAVGREGKAVSIRSDSFNHHVLEPFFEVGANVAMRLTIDGFDGREMEFDGIIWWQGRIILVEAKCLRSLDGPHDDWRAKFDIDYAIAQLIRARTSVQRDWTKIRKKLESWGLPEVAPNPETVICIAVTNVMRFTTLSRDGVIVTDALCLRRFFAKDPFIYFHSTTGERRAIGRIRMGDEPSATELGSILLLPLHLQWIFKGFKFQWSWVSSFSKELPIRFMTAAFSGNPEVA